MPVLTCRQVRFYAPGDEFIFFAWLGNIKAVRKVVGSKDAILLHVHRRISEKALRELFAVFFRYRIDMAQLAQFESSSNRAWFTAPKTYWHNHAFRKSAVKKVV